jgi:hypothetical protein
MIVLILFPDELSGRSWVAGLNAMLFSGTRCGILFLLIPVEMSSIVNGSIRSNIKQMVLLISTKLSLLLKVLKNVLALIMTILSV